MSSPKHDKVISKTERLSFGKRLLMFFTAVIIVALLALCATLLISPSTLYRPTPSLVFDGQQMYIQITDPEIVSQFRDAIEKATKEKKQKPKEQILLNTYEIRIHESGFSLEDYIIVTKEPDGFLLPQWDDFLKFEPAYYLFVQFPDVDKNSTFLRIKKLLAEPQEGNYFYK